MYKDCKICLKRKYKDYLDLVYGRFGSQLDLF